MLSPTLVLKSSATATKYGSIGIVGGGIGGLTFANALLKKSNLVSKVQIYERASHFIPTAGAGFGLSMNGQICLSSLGINDYRHKVQPFDGIVRLNREGTDILAQTDVFATLRQKHHGFGFAGCLRADLIDLLIDHLEEHHQQESNNNNTSSSSSPSSSSSQVLHYSHEVVRISQIANKVELEFSNGHEDVFDLVIGADGINSFVASQLVIDPSPSPIYSNSNIFYGKISNPDTVEYLQHHPFLSNTATIVNSPATGQFLAHYAGAASSKTFLWAATYASKEPPSKQRKEWDEGHKSELIPLLETFPSTHPIHELAALTTEENLLHFGLFYQKHKKTWTNGDGDGRVVLLGDSCHATLPYAGQGANQAMEDAITLADQLDDAKNTTYQKAYQSYYKKRFERTRRIVRMANFMNRVYHTNNWLLKKLRDHLLVSALGGDRMLRQIEKELLEDCPVQDFQRFAPSSSPR